MEGEQKFQGGVEAMEEKLKKVEERLSSIIKLETSEKVSALHELIKELGATYEGTDIPLDNDYGDVVERIGFLLTVEKSRLQLENLKSRHPELV